jgi:hypothetical protein
MPLQFLVASQQYMQFLDLEAEVQAPVDAGDLEANHKHAVFVFLQNTEPIAYKGVALSAWHDTFGVGVRGVSSLIIQPETVDVPAQVNGAPGIAMVRFMFMTPSGGRGRLAAKVLPSGPSVTQPVRIRSNAARQKPPASPYLEEQI